MKKISLLICGLLVMKATAQMADTLALDLPQAETLLLQNNLGLLAEQLNIDKAEAEMVQAKVWPNPTISFDEINPYVTTYQKRHAEEQASLFGSEEFGKYRQISVQLEQLIELGGKRKKRKALAQISAEKATAYLADFLADLRTEFRKTVFSFYYHRKYVDMLKEELKSLEQIVNAYEAQHSKGNVNKTELIRLRSSRLKLTDEIIEERNNISALQADLVVLLNLPDNTVLTFEQVFKTLSAYKTPQKYNLETLQGEALKKRPAIRLAELGKEGAEKQLAYEESLAVPDLTFSVGYDRGGGIYPDFVGLGVAIDLPFSKPNKGRIKKAQISVQQETYRYDKYRKTVKAEIRKKYQKLLHLNRFFEGIDPQYLSDLDQTMRAYERNFRQQTINTFQFVDFMESYMDNQESILQKKRDYHNTVEELKYATGLDDLEY